MSVTGFAATPAEFDDETRHIVAPPSRWEHHLHHHHHREGRFVSSSHDRREVGGLEMRTDEGLESGEHSEEGELVITATQKMLSACSGSLLTSLLVTPLDVVRVRLQSQHTQPLNPSTITPEPTNVPNTSLRAHKLVPPQFQSTWARLPTETGVTACCREVFWNPNNAEFCIASPANSTSAAFADACAVEETSRRRFTGTWEGLVKIARYEGTSSLWRGLSPTLLMAIPANVIYFTGYDSLRTSPLSPFSDLNSTWAPLLAGSSARTIAATAISPLELFRTRLWAASTPKANVNGESVAEIGAFRNTINGLVGMVKLEGWTSLWRGLTLTLWRDVPFSGIYWFGYEAIKNRLEVQHARRNQQLFSTAMPSVKTDHSANTFTDSFIAGALSGCVAAFLTTPFDVGKTRIQVVQHAPSPASEATAIRAGYAGGTAHLGGVYKSMPSLLHGIWKVEGIRGLWRGCVPRMLKVAPACAIMISSYEVGKQWAEKHNQKRSDRTE